MNLYDMKSIHCCKCDKFIGEIECDAVVVFSECGQCANPLPEGDDKALYTINKYKINPKSLELVAV